MNRHLRVPSVLTGLVCSALVCLVLTFMVVPAQAGQFEDDLLVLINRYRVSKKLKPLTESAVYVSLAREHSQTMQEQGRMSHDGFEDRFKRSDATSCVENVGWNQQTPQSLFDGWKNSPGHNRNLLTKKLKAAGIDKSGAYVTYFACY